MNLTPQLIMEYGAVVFLFTTATLLVREILTIFKGKLKDTWENTESNKNTLTDMSKNLKEGAVIQAHILRRMNEGNEVRDRAWDRLMENLEKMCELLSNGNGYSMKSMKQSMKEQREDMREQHSDMGIQHNDMTGQYRGII